MDPAAPLNERARQALLLLMHGGLARLAKRIEAVREVEFDASTLWNTEAEHALAPMFGVWGNDRRDLELARMRRRSVSA